MSSEYRGKLTPTPLALLGLDIRFRNVEEAIQKEHEMRKEIMKRGARAGINRHTSNVTGF